MSHYNLRKTESSLNIRGVDKKLPFWDSSDPTRNPQPLPINPDSPSLNPISPFRGGAGSPTRNHGLRTLGALEDDKIGELTELTRKMNETQSAVEKAVNEALSEFGTLAYRSRDNASALSQLKDMANRTEEHVFSMKSSLEESLVEMKNAMDTQKDTRRSLDTVADGLMESVGDVVGMMHTHDRYLKDIAETSGGVNKELKEALDQLASLTKDSQSGPLDEIKQVVEHHYTKLYSSFSAIQDLVSEYNSRDQQSFKKIDKLIVDKASLTDATVKAQIKSLETNFERLSTRQTREIAQQYQEVNKSHSKDLEPILQALNTTSTISDVKKLESSMSQSTAGVSGKLDIISESIQKFEEGQKTHMEISQKLLAVAGTKQKSASKDQATEIIAELTRIHEDHSKKLMDRFSGHEEHYSGLRDILESLNGKSVMADELLNLQGEQTRAKVEKLLQSHYDTLMAKLLGQEKYLTGFETTLSSLTGQSGKTDLLINQQSENIKSTVDMLLKSHQEQLMTKLTGQDEIFSGLKDVLESVNDRSGKVDGLITQQKEQVQTGIERLLRSHQETVQAEISTKHKEILGFLTKAEAEHSKHYETLSGLFNEQSVKEQPDQSTVLKDILSAQLDKSDKGIKEILEKLEGDIKSQGTSVQDGLQNEMKLVRAEIAGISASEQIREVKNHLSSSSERNTKELSEIQADVRSLIDLRYNEANSFQETVKRLEAKLDSNQQLLDANKRIQELENLLSQKEQKSSSKKAVADYQETLIAKNEKKIEHLESEIQRLTGSKEAISVELGNLRFEMKSRIEELDRLEERISAFESRVGDTILDRSKNILGSSTLSIINNRALNTPSTPISTSPSKRNLSYAPIDFDEENMDPDADTSLSIGKSRGPGLSPQKNRSISLYTPN